MRTGVFTLLSIAGAVALAALTAGPARSQSTSEQQGLSPTITDRFAADEAEVRYRHARPAQTEAGSALRQSNLVEIRQRRASASAGGATSAELESNDQARFPADLTFLGGAVVQMAESHPIFLLPNGKCPIALCWGNPEGFLRDFAGSEFAHITDQYVHEGASNRYTLGADASIAYKPTPATKPLIDADIRAFVHTVAAKDGIGLHHIYHVFLPPGQDECFTAAATACYSPDNPNTFAFCGYHSSVKFKDLPDEVLYIVEPFQDVPGCSVRPGTPNGHRVDSTNNTLSHELIETITDPNGDAWINFSAVILAGAEIGDECSFFVVLPQGNNFAVFFDPSVFRVGSHLYAVQPEYNNEDHACTVQP